MLTVKSGPYQEDRKNYTPMHVFPYPLDHFQKHACRSIDKEHNVLVTAHTGCGKTTIAEYGIAYTIQKNSKIIYTAPIKALSNQLYKDLRRKYPHWDVGIRTGDIDVNPDAQVLIMTTEILRNLLYHKRQENMSNIDLVIFDEVHYIKDRDRGSVWEESIILMPKNIKMIMLSATLPDADKFGEWVAQTSERDTDYVTTTERVVPLTHYVMTEKELIPIMDHRGRFDNKEFLRSSKLYDFSQINIYVRFLRDRNLLPAFFFCFSREKCQRYAKSISVPLVDGQTACLIEQRFDRELRVFGTRFNGLHQVNELRSLLTKGIGYHHSGLLPVLKEIVEILFTESPIKVLFVTETFAAGVNMPTKTVVFTDLSKYDGYRKDFRLLLPEEYHQMSGRAGRRGLDTQGNVIILPFHKFPDLPDIKSIMCGSLSPISSRFKIDCLYVLRTMQSEVQKEIKNEIQEEVQKEIIGKTLAQRETNAYLSELSQEISIAENHPLILKPPIFSFGEELLKLSMSPFLSQKDRKRLKNLQKNVDSASLQQELSQQNTYNEAQEQIIYLKETYKEHAEWISSAINENRKFLISKEYITEDLTLTLKGRVATLFKECDGILMTEILWSPLNLFSNLSFSDIIAVLRS